MKGFDIPYTNPCFANDSLDLTRLKWFGIEREDAVTFVMRAGKQSKQLRTYILEIIISIVQIHF